jgi:hypothetical protein
VRQDGLRPGTDAVAVNKSGGNRTDSGHCALRRPHHLDSPRGTTRQSRPYPTGTPWRSRHPSTASTSRYSGSRLPSPNQAGDVPLSAPAVIAPGQAAPGTLPNGGLLPVSPPISLRRTPSDRPCRAPSFDAKFPQTQSPCGWISYPSLCQNRPGAWPVTLAADAFDDGLCDLNPAALAVVVLMLERLRGLIARVWPNTI